MPLNIGKQRSRSTLHNDENKENAPPTPKLFKGKVATSVKRVPFAEIHMESPQIRNSNSSMLLKRSSTLFAKHVPGSARTSIGDFAPQTPGTEIPLKHIRSPKLSPFSKHVSDNEESSIAPLKRKTFRSRDSATASLLSFGEESIIRHQQHELYSSDVDEKKSLRWDENTVSSMTKIDIKEKRPIVDGNSDSDDPFGFAKVERQLEKKKTRAKIMSRPLDGLGAGLSSAAIKVPSPLKNEGRNVPRSPPPTTRRQIVNLDSSPISSLSSDTTLSPLAPGQLMHDEVITKKEERLVNMDYKRIISTLGKRRNQPKPKVDSESDGDEKREYEEQARKSRRPRIVRNAKAAAKEIKLEDDFDSVCP
jgi:hypothetical protein